jgi:hypothetical protein
MVEQTETLTAAELSAQRLALRDEDRKKNAGKPGYSRFGVKLGGRGGTDMAARARASSAQREADRKELEERRAERKRVHTIELAVNAKARKGLPRFKKDLQEMAAKDEAQREKIKDQGVMQSPEEIQQLLVDLRCDPIARMAAIAERAEKAGELNTAANLYKELAQYAAPKRKAAEPKVIKDKNLTIMSEEELLAEIARLESSIG